MKCKQNSKARHSARPAVAPVTPVGWGKGGGGSSGVHVEPVHGDPAVEVCAGVEDHPHLFGLHDLCVHSAPVQTYTLGLADVQACTVFVHCRNSLS